MKEFRMDSDMKARLAEKLIERAKEKEEQNSNPKKGPRTSLEIRRSLLNALCDESELDPVPTKVPPGYWMLVVPCESCVYRHYAIPLGMTETEAGCDLAKVNGGPARWASYQGNGVLGWESNKGWVHATFTVEWLTSIEGGSR